LLVYPVLVNSHQLRKIEISGDLISADNCSWNNNRPEFALQKRETVGNGDFQFVEVK